MYIRRGSIKLYDMPELRQPYMIAAWSGMGAVALLTANYLRQSLNAEFFGEIDPHAFFSPSQVLVQDGLIQVPEFAETKFFYWDGGRSHDLVFLIGTEQPSGGYEMALQVLDTARELHVERIYTTAALANFVHHAQEPRVWGTATNPELLDEVQEFGVSPLTEGTLGGLNGLLLATAREREIEGICLLGEIPVYATNMINPKTSRAILAVLGRMLGVEVELAKLDQWAEDLAPQMDQLYNILRDDVKENIERGAWAGTTPPSVAADVEETLVADEQLFQEIEQFLEGRGHPEEEEGDGEQDDEA